MKLDAEARASIRKLTEAGHDCPLDIVLQLLDAVDAAVDMRRLYYRGSDCILLDSVVAFDKALNGTESKPETKGDSDE